MQAAKTLGIARNALVLQILWEWTEAQATPQPGADKRG